MGLFDKLKKKLGDAKDQLAPAPAPEPEPAYEAEADDTDAHAQVELDLAGFDPDDEGAFFHAVLHMESEGQFGGTDESRAEIMQRYGIRDRAHWQHVKDSVYTVLIHRHGSAEEVGQREINWRTGQMQRHMQGQIAKQASGGGFAPVEGVTLEAWAAINAAIAGGQNPDDLLKGAAIDRGRWERASAEWNARMATDTTFAIATVYGNAFQAASQGKYNQYAKEAMAARAANRDLALEPPVSLEQFWEILYEQSYAAALGKDPVETLRACGLSVVDWTDLGSYMGYFFHRTAVRHWQEYETIHKRVQARFAAKYPGVQAAGADVSFA